MKISLNWIKDYVNLDGLATEKIVEKLTMSGLEVEDYIDQNVKYGIYPDFLSSYININEKFKINKLFDML